VSSSIQRTVCATKTNVGEPPSVIASWDAEEYGIVGSTEWVEDHANWLTETAVAYLNIDVGVSGPHTAIAATPELSTVGAELLKKVIAPNKGDFNESLYETWQRDYEGVVDVLGSGSDYTAFVHYGISSVRAALSLRFHL
jgi:N-acetylated-alpha-linked acidic dipeptidase